MKPRDLLIVTRKFWPHSGLTEIALCELATNLVHAGHQVTVATAQWSREWSQCIHYHGIPVIRFARPIAGPWSSFRYTRSLARHFSTTKYDGIIAVGMDDEATAALKTMDDRVPVMLYLDESHLPANGLTKKQIGNLNAADAVIATSPCVASILAESSVASHTIASGIVAEDRNRSDQQLIRAGLAKAHQILALEPQQRLAVSFTRMDTPSQLQDLIVAWQQVICDFPQAKLWLIGEGEFAGAIWQRIVDLDLAYSVLLPGNFDQLIDVYSAADLYIHSAGAEQSADGMLRAMACGTPVISTRNKFTEQLISHQTTGLLIPPVDTVSWADSICNALASAGQRNAMSDSAKRDLAQRYLPAQQVEGYIDLLSSLTEQLVESSQ